MTSEELEQLAKELKALSESLMIARPPEMKPATMTRIRKIIEEAYGRLRAVASRIDPIKEPDFIFDPSNPNIVGRFVGIAMIAQPRKPLAEIERFYGSGVYALYYSGNFSAYKSISKHEHPIYVGKADPEDPKGESAKAQGDRLSRRLKDHRKNLEKAGESLNLKDFEYRALVVQSGWQTAAEDYLIQLFKPIWNNEIGICYGFGKHGDSAETRKNKRSPWDTLHAGRKWAGAGSLVDAKPRAQILKEIEHHLSENPPFQTVDKILRRFLEEMRSMS